MTTWTSGSPVPNPSKTWNDDPVVASITEVRKQHLVELREALEIYDGHYHSFEGYTSGPELPDIAVSWEDATGDIHPKQTKIRAQHWTELRTTVENADNHYHNVPDLGYDSTTLDLSVPGVWSTGLVAGSKPRKPHIDELRTCIATLSSHIHTACCDSECHCQCTCTCTCQEDCCSQCWMFD